MEVHHRHHEEQNLELNSDEIDELAKLEEDVKSMAQKIAEFRETLPDQLKNTLASIIAAQRPARFTAPDHNSDPGPSDNLNSDSEQWANKTLVEKDPIHTEKLKKIKKQICDNASMMPLLVKRMKDCMSKIDNLQPFKHDTELGLVKDKVSKPRVYSRRPRGVIMESG